MVGYPPKLSQPKLSQTKLSQTKSSQTEARCQDIRHPDVLPRYIVASCGICDLDGLCRPEIHHPDIGHSHLSES